MRRVIGRRVRLDGLAKTTLGMRKAGDGLQAIRWWREGQIDRLVRYCRRDVEITWRLFAFGLDHRYVLYSDSPGQLRRIPVEWRERTRLPGALHPQ